MKKPLLASTRAKAQKLALELSQTDDWRTQLLAVYYLQFYMKPREIVDFLKIKPTIVRDTLKVLNKVRRNPGLVRLPSLKDALNATESNKDPQIRIGRAPQ